MPLTSAKVAELLRSGASVKVPDGRSMYLVIRGVGKGYFIGQYRDHANGGRFQTRGLGRAPDTSLAAARRAWEDDRAARRGRVHMGNGSSDSATAPKVIPVPTGTPFGAASAEFVIEKVKANEWRGGATGKTAKLYAADARTLLPDGRPLAKVTWPELTDEIIGLYVAGMNDRKAKDTKERLEAVREFQKTGKIKTKKIVAHHVALPWANVPAFFKKLDLDGSPAARALAFTILTAVRIGDVVGTGDNGKPPATWGEIDSDGLWTIPGDDANGKGRTKSGATHTVPLSQAALALLGPRGADDAPLFPALSYFQVYRFKKDKLKLDVDIHGFRSSFRDWCGDHGIDRELAEMNMAHSVGDQTEQAYRRSAYIARRKPIMERWTEHCT